MPAALLLLALAVMAVAYWPGRGLFFRNDDWFHMRKMEAMLRGRSGKREHLLRDTIPHEEGELLRHFHPVSMMLLYGKYRFLGVDFRAHFTVSLMLHLASAAMCAAVVTMLTGDAYAGMLAGALLAANGSVADTLLWPGQAAWLLVNLLTLAGLWLHPNLAPQGVVCWVLFYAVNAVLPFVFELGLVAVLLNLALFFLPGHASAAWGLPLAAFLGASAWVRLASRVPADASGFVGLAALAKNVGAGFAKMLFGLGGGRFHIVVADTLYLMGVRADASAAVSLAVLALLCPAMAGGGWLTLVLAGAALAPFVLVSLAVDASNPNKELGNQMPRYFLCAAGLMSVCLGLAAASLGLWPAVDAVLAALAVCLGAGFVREQIALIKPHTDTMRRDVALVRAGGRVARSGFHPTTMDYRLDWYFNHNSVLALLGMEKKPPCP